MIGSRSDRSYAPATSLRGASAPAAFSKIARHLMASAPSVPIAEGAQEHRVREIMAAVHAHYGGADSPPLRMRKE